MSKTARKGLGFVVAMLTALVLCAPIAARAEEPEKVLKEQPFAAFQDADWSNFAWGAKMTKELTDEHSKDEGKAVKVVKYDITDMGNNGASVYLQRFGEKVQAMGLTEPVGVSFWAYNAAALESGGLAFKFGDVEQTDITCVHEGATEVLATRDLDYTGSRRYTVPFPDGLDLASVNEFQIMLWGNSEVEITYSAFVVNYYGEAEPDVDPPAPPVYDELGAYATPISGYNDAKEAALWSLSGQSGTTYSTALNTDSAYVHEGAGSMKYTWSNPTYSFGWTETYIDVTELIQKNKDKGLKGISFWIYNTAPQEVGKVGFWVKMAEKDQEEYEVDAAKLKTGTKLDFTGWQKIEVPFSAVTNQQSYAPAGNGTFDAEELAFIKIGLWSNYNDVVDVAMYVDDVQLTADSKLVSLNEQGEGPSASGEPGETEKTKISPWVWVGVAAGCVVLAAGAVTLVFVLKNRKKK